MTRNNRKTTLLTTPARRRPSVLWISSSSSSSLSPSAPSKRRPWQGCKLLIWKWSQKVEAWQTRYCQDYICKQYFWEHRSFSWNGFDMWILKFSSWICQWNAWIKINAHITRQYLVINIRGSKSQDVFCGVINKRNVVCRNHFCLHRNNVKD